MITVTENEVTYGVNAWLANPTTTRRYKGMNQ